MSDTKRNAAAKLLREHCTDSAGAAAQLDCTDRTIRRRCEAGELVPIARLGDTPIFWIADLAGLGKRQRGRKSST